MTDNRFSTFDRRILVAAVLCLLIFSYLLYDDRLFMSLFAQHGAVVAEVTQQTEDVRVKFAAGFNWRPALKGQEIYVGDSLFTGDKSGASIKFKDSSSAEVSANSLITFTEANGKYIITLKQGIVLNSQGPIQIVNEVQKRAPASIPSPRPEITSPKTYTKNIIKMNPDDSLDGQQIVDVHWRYDKPLSSFIIEYASDPQFSNIELTQTTEEHHSKSPLLLEGSHFIRVREKDVNNKKMPWSNVVQVEIAISKPEHNKVLSAVQLKDPYIKKAINNPTPIAITWEAIEGAKGYLIEIASTEDLKNSKKIQLSDHQYIVKDYKPGSIYYQVSAFDSKDSISEGKARGKVDIVVDPPAISPTKGHFYWAKSSNEDCPPWEFLNRWGAIPTIRNYEIEVSQSPDFADPSIQTKTDKTQYVARLSGNGKYYWHVRALKADGSAASEFSSTGEFTYTLERPLTSPALVEPAQNMTLFFQKKKNTPFYLTWENVDRAKEYIVEVAADPEFKNPVLSKTLSESKLLISESMPRGNLYWHVRAVNGDHVSDWSEARKMMVFAGRTPASAQGK